MSPASPPAAALPRRSRKRRGDTGPARRVLRGRRPGWKAIGGAFAAVVATLVGVVQLVDWIESKASPPPPAEIGARFTDVDMLPNVPYADYLASAGADAPPAGDPRRRQVGNVFSVRVRLRGYRGQELPLRWAVYDAETRSRVRGRYWEQTGLTFEPRNDDHAGRGRLWVPIPSQSGTFLVRLTLQDGEGQILDERDSQPFDVAAP